MSFPSARAHALNIEYLPIGDLKPDPKNPRKHSQQQIKMLARAIDELGFNNPILIDKKNRIIAGHGRLEAAKSKGLETIPSIRLEHLNAAQVKAFRIADNRIAELAEWDMEGLKLELEELKNLDLNFDLTLTGFEMPKIEMIMSPTASVANPEEDILPALTEPVTRLGDIWVLGNHRIICGDALKSETYAQLLEGEKADLVFTDPPYNVPIDGHVLAKNKHDHGDFIMAAGEMSDNEFERFLGKVIGHMRNHSSNGSIHFICMDWRHIRHLLAAGVQYDDLKNICVWNKTNGGMGSFYRSKHEMICVFKHGDNPHVNNIELGKHGRYRTNVWDYPGQTTIHKDSGDLELHPTPKPVQMVADAILDCSSSDQIVLDVFGGSGSTLIAAEKTKRHARLIEIEPRYVDATIRRWEKLTGQKAKLAADGYNFTTTLMLRKAEAK